jgi:ferredoxin
MALRITADTAACRGIAVCVMTSPDLFDVDETRKVTVLVTEVADEHRAAAEAAVRGCPARALTLHGG